jgi:hypothetical protein
VRSSFALEPPCQRHDQPAENAIGHCRAGPGEVVVLPAEEIAWLKERGFVEDESAAPVERTTTGPTPAA